MTMTVPVGWVWVVTIVPDGVCCVVCMVVVIGCDVVITAPVPATSIGAGGGGAETTCDSGSDAQPPMSAIALHKARSEANACGV